MMSYLWILLLGSLLATSAKAEGDEEADDPDAPAPDADPEPELDGEADPDEDTEADTEEDPPSDSETTVEPVTPAVADAEPDQPEFDDAELDLADVETTTPGGDVEPNHANEEVEATTPGGDLEPNPEDEDVEATTPGGDVEPNPEDEDVETTPAGSDMEPNPLDEDVQTTEPAAPEDEDEEPTTPAADAEAEIFTTEEPVAGDPDYSDQNEDNVTTEEAPGLEESGPDDQPTPEPYPEVKEDIKLDHREIINAAVPEVVPTAKEGDAVECLENDGAFDLKDALLEPNAGPGKSRSLDTGAQSAGARANGKPQTQKTSSGTLAGILCAIGVAAVGAVTGYFTYQRKQLCFKNRQEADPEAPRKADAAEAQADPQVLSNLLDKQ